jgi:hypothetical protein
MGCMHWSDDAAVCVRVSGWCCFSFAVVQEPNSTLGSICIRSWRRIRVSIRRWSLYLRQQRLQVGFPPQLPCSSLCNGHWLWARVNSWR